MKQLLFKSAWPGFLFFLSMAACLLSCKSDNKKDLSSYVNPFIGTGAHGHTYPGASLPHAMVQLSPDTRTGNWDACAGYHYSDSSIMGFSHTHLSGTGVADFGDILFLPVTLEASKYQYAPVSFSHKNEKAAPGYYAVKLDNGVFSELTVTPHVGIQRHTASKGAEMGMWIDVTHQLADEEIIHAFFERIDDYTIRGRRKAIGWAENQDIYFITRFSAKIKDIEWQTGNFDPGQKFPKAAGVIHFDELPKGQIEIATGLSFVSLENAAKNLIAEYPDFDFEGAKLKAREIWNDRLSRYQIESKDENKMTVFYTAVYHTALVPNLYSDVDGSYRGMDQAIRKSSHPYYSTFSLWDTFRAWHPLMTLEDSTFVNDMIRSMITMSVENDFFPMWAFASSETGTMIGYHGASVLVDAFNKGIRGYDAKLALSELVKSSGKGVRGRELYREKGFLPANRFKESVSRTLEYAYNDWCISALADSLTAHELAAQYKKDALNYRKVFDGSTGFFRGKNEDGSWREPFMPDHVSREFTEATPWQYRFFVPHDIKGLSSMFGTKEALEMALDSLFSVESEVKGNMPDITGLIGQYAHGNEPSHHMAYLFNYLNQPAKTAYWVSKILNEMYTNTPEGIIGNEDCGQMSAWYVFSSMGFYPVCPGSNEYIIGTPNFTSLTLRLYNGNELRIEADKEPSPRNPYVKTLTWNGEALSRPFIRHEEIMQGGILRFELSSNSGDSFYDGVLPYSLSTHAEPAMPYCASTGGYFEDQIEIVMGTRSPGAKVFYSLDGGQPNIEYKAPFMLDRDAQIKAITLDKDGSQSDVMFMDFIRVKYQNPLSLNYKPRQGLRYWYYEGKYQSVFDMNPATLISRGIISNFSFEPARIDDHFGFIYEGLIQVPETALYEFFTYSDDGSVLWINNQLVVDNDGSHASIRSDGKIGLKAGLHRLKLAYFEDYEGQELRVGYRLPGGRDQYVEEDMLFMENK
ncbi:MAG: GH92 family glycosyl hydrolase [Cyclobacteriaceae bacterium]|nr:GH92 family glycosyl hydrolase [Cyclobacteriaceae bacterium]